MDVERFILEHGAWSYLVTLVWTFFEGETFVLLAGFAAAQGVLSAPILIVAAWLGSFAGDQCYFWIGRHFGLRLMARRPDWRRRVDRALAWLKRYDVGFILSFRFIYGVRNFSSFALGISGISWRRFLAFNFLAAFIWACAFVGIGFLCGHALRAHARPRHASDEPRPAGRLRRPSGRGTCRASPAPQSQASRRRGRNRGVATLGGPS